MAAEIKRALPAREVLEHYGFHPSRTGFLQCPFHQGDKHGSLKVYDGERGWHCFGCGRGGSVIDFVMELFGIGFREACLRLNEEFHLGLSDRKPSRAEVSALLRARQEAEARREREAEEYRQVAEEHRYWWEVLKYFDFPHPLWCEAVKRQPYLEDWLDEHLGAGR